MLATQDMRALPGIGRRLASMAYESLLLLGILSVGFLVPHLALGLGFGVVLPGFVLLGHVFLLLAAYFIWYWQRNGQTLAMQTWKLKLTTPSAVPPAPTFLVLRYVLAWPSVLFYGAGLLWALFDKDRQFLHDRLAGTRIVYQNDINDAQPTTPTTPQPARK